jgi:quinol monooxygenase YgiN
MALINDRDAGEYDKPVISVIKIKIDPADAPGLLASALDTLAIEGKDLHGFLAAQVLLSVDNRTMVVMTEWSDRHAWGKSRYDPGVQKLIERLTLKSSTIEFEIYTRCGTVPGLRV